MKRRVVGWIVGMSIVCGGFAVAYAAEQAGSATAPKATSTGAPAASQPGAAQEPSALEGTTWMVKVTPDTMAVQKGEKPFDDSLIFKDGKVTMSACVKMGFAPSSYSVIPSAAGVSFTTHQVSTDQGTTRWTGTFTGQVVTGTMTLTRKDSSSSHYIFEGKKAPNT